MVSLIKTAFLSSILNLKNGKHFKKMKNEGLMPIARHPKRCWNFCVAEDEKKEIEPVFTKGL